MHNAAAASPHFLFPVGTQVVALIAIQGPNGKVAHPRGAVGVVVHTPVDNDHLYRVRFPDGFESLLKRAELVPLAHYKQGMFEQFYRIGMGSP
jgi:hypothetical protein